MRQLLSPSGRYQITLHEHEAFNSHWVETPTLLDKQTGQTLLAIRDTSWSLDEAEWQGDSVVRWVLRKYPGNHQPSDLVALVDCEAGTATVGEGTVVPLSGLEACLNGLLTWIHAAPAVPRESTGLARVLRKLLGGE